MTERDRPDLVSRRDVALFGAIVLACGLLLGALALRRPGALAVAGVATAAAWLACIAACRSLPRRARVLGVLVPAVLLATRYAADVRDGTLAAAAVAALGLGTAFVVWLSPAFGRRLRAGWMDAVEPVGWSVSRALLAIVYYLVLTPVGIALRLSGKDPLRRRTGRDAASFWTDHEGTDDPERYFRQY